MLKRFFDKSVHDQPESVLSRLVNFVGPIFLLAVIAGGAWATHYFWSVRRWSRLVVWGFIAMLVMGAAAQLFVDRVRGVRWHGIVDSYGGYRLMFALSMSTLIASNEFSGYVAWALIGLGYSFGTLFIALVYRRLRASA